MQKKYNCLGSQEIINTLDRLYKRIEERFPNSGLGKVTAEVKQTASEAKATIAKINSPHKVYRAITCVLILLALSLMIWILSHVGGIGKISKSVDLLEFIEAGISSIVFIGAGTIFIVTLENRYKRYLIAKAMHELRSFSHVIDMHQLTKNPESILMRGNKTTSSPVRNLSAFELGRYLDYCSELLSLISKIASMYVDDFMDQTALEAADQVQRLTDALSHKIWQKLNILNQHELHKEQNRPKEEKPVEKIEKDQ